MKKLRRDSALEGLKNYSKYVDVYGTISITKEEIEKDNALVFTLLVQGGEGKSYNVNILLHFI